MSRVPESHGERLAPYIAADESVITGCVEQAADAEGDESKTSVATDSRIVRLTVTEDEEQVLSVPYVQVTSASITVVDRERRELTVALAGLLLATIGLAGFVIGLGPRVGIVAGPTIGDGAILGVVLVAATTLLLAGLAFVALGLRTGDPEVHLELTTDDGTEPYSAVLSRGQLEFAQTVSRLIGVRSRTPTGHMSAAGRTRVGPSDE